MAAVEENGPSGTDVEVQWLPLPDVAELLGVQLREVRGMLAEQRLLAVRRLPGAVWTVPSTFFIEAAEGEGPQPVPGLRGTLIQLADAGMNSEEALAWLHTRDEQLGGTPISVLRTGAVHSVRRAAQVLAW
ncbi:Rv2175c family DNA-binding protein [Pseudactinotalea sp. Z1748]|uniref:Rv2175c family DNA-binding protein n=1 Tax=Pseudactinotalea sp. Z1748 TaxID=3413027 RepID=UPI003C7A8E79